MQCLSLTAQQSRVNLADAARGCQAGGRSRVRFMPEMLAQRGKVVVARVHQINHILILAVGDKSI